MKVVASIVSFVSALCAGCAQYVPGSLVTAPSGVQYANTLTAGCLDLVVNIECSAETRPGAVIVRVDLGNRCDHGTPIDFTQLAVFDGDPRGSMPMAVYDPRAEIVAGRIAPHGSGLERIEFDRNTPDTDPPQRVCVRAAAMFDATSRAAMCFDARSPGGCPTTFLGTVDR